MQIMPVSYGYNTSFNASARMNLGNGSTAVADVIHNQKGNIQELKVKIVKDRQEQGAFTQKWKKGIAYDVFLKSSWTERICKKLGITEESDQENISDVIFHAELNEIQRENIDNQIGADTYPDDSYSDIFPYADFDGCDF